MDIKKKYKKVLVANRGDVAIRVFRSCTELGIRTVAIFTEKDRIALHRYKADEAYLVRDKEDGTDGYLNYKYIVDLAIEKGVDAIHPGYGFLSESSEFARECITRGVDFIGPMPKVLDLLGDKVKSKELAKQIKVPVIESKRIDDDNKEQVLEFVKRVGLPVVIKARYGGGGRGMRVVEDLKEFDTLLKEAAREVGGGFAKKDLFVEKFIKDPKHIEVQILADKYGNIVHLFERDCSIQRRFQKMVEYAPAIGISRSIKNAIYDYAKRIVRKAGLTGACTVEFLIDKTGEIYFLEVNPRLQVEHTVTENITGIDIVMAQILIAQGYSLKDPPISIKNQRYVKKHGYSIQCRVTAEDPSQGFLPQTGRLLAYRPPDGFGIRLDTGNVMQGTIVTSEYDSLLVKVVSWALTFELATKKMVRALREMRIRGIKTNVQFLEKVVSHPTFIKGKATVNFLEEHPEVFVFPEKKDRATKLLRFIGDTIVNSERRPPSISYNEYIASRNRILEKIRYLKEKSKKYHCNIPRPKEILDTKGPYYLSEWLLASSDLKITDTTMRDAHQSLFSTRLRTFDILPIAEFIEYSQPDLFSCEVWGGATFDVALRFLKEDPWERLRKIRNVMPGTLLQMLLRGKNCVGYSSYPIKVVDAFIDRASETGIDVFRIFDSLNDVENMRHSIDRVIKAGRVAEVAICYTGDVTSRYEDKYTIDYYIDLAKKIEDTGAHILAIKDMAGLLKPEAATLLISEIKQNVRIPVHLHTHDSTGLSILTVLAAADAGVDIVDCAVGPFSGGTSQPSLEKVLIAMANHKRKPVVDLTELIDLSDYLRTLKRLYQPFSVDIPLDTMDVYRYEVPGGQFSNLYRRAESLGLAKRWREVLEAYRLADSMLGRLPKVTPSSKMVADFAMFMVQNDVNRENFMEKIRTLDLPVSLVDYFEKRLGNPPFGFPEWAYELGLVSKKKNKEKREKNIDQRIEDVTSYMFPEPYRDFLKHLDRFSDVSVLDSYTFFYGMKILDEIWTDIEPGKTLIIKLISIGRTDERGKKRIFFELNGHPRDIIVDDNSAVIPETKRVKGDPENPSHVVSSISGKVIAVLVSVGTVVNANDPVITVEAMKMETNFYAKSGGTVTEIFVKEGDQVEPMDLLCIVE